MTPRTIRIERKAANVPEAAEQLRAALLKAGRHEVTPADASATSGLPLGLCEAALFELATRCPTRLQVGEAATLRFAFASLSQARTPAGMGGWLKRCRSLIRAFWLRHAEAVKTTVLLALVPPFSGPSPATWRPSPSPSALMAASCIWFRTRSRCRSSSRPG